MPWYQIAVLVLTCGLLLLSIIGLVWDAYDMLQARRDKKKLDRIRRRNGRDTG